MELKERLSKAETALLKIDGLYGDNTDAARIVKDYFDSIPVDCQVKPAKNVKDYDWLNNKLDEILGELEHKHITKAGAKDRLFEFIFEELVNEIQKLKDSSLSV